MMDYKLLFDKIHCSFGISPDEGKVMGMYDAQDWLDENAGIERRHAARIFHMLMLKACDISDIDDISQAGELLDLYDCRVCVNHIAQVYLRGIMKARLERIFDGRAYITAEEVECAIDGIVKIKSDVLSK